MIFKYLSVFLFGLLSLVHIGVSAKSLQLPHIEVVPIRESRTGHQYELYIKLPEDYDVKSNKKYPVIYYTDAMWHVELLSSATSFLMEDAILVGISWQTDIHAELAKEEGAHVSRFRDYTFVKSNNPEVQAKYGVGQASKHLSFIRDEVFKYVESHYSADPVNRTYFGYSLGGLFGAYALLAQRDTFKNYIIGSPSMRWLSQLKAVANKNNKRLNANVFISHGSQEEELSGQVDAFIDYLNSRKDDSLSLTYAVPEGSHQTAFPATGVRSVTWLSNLYKSENK